MWLLHGWLYVIIVVQWLSAQYYDVYILKSHNNVQGGSVYGEGEGGGGRDPKKKPCSAPIYSQYMRINVPLHNNLAV